MNQRRLSIAAALLGFALALGFTAQHHRAPRDEGAGAAAGSAATADPASAPARPAATAAATAAPEKAGPGASTASPPEPPPGAAGDDERLAFRQRAQDFLRDAPELDATTRDARAAQLDADISRYEADRTLSAGEAVVLRAEIIRLTVSDELTRVERLTELTERYRAEAQRRNALRAATPDPQLVEYQARERAIVQEVAAMTTIPDGLSREEYLRRRLQRERELTFR